MKRVSFLVVLCLLLILSGCRIVSPRVEDPHPAAPVVPVAPTIPPISEPKPVLPALPPDNVRVTWTSGALSEELMPFSYGTVIMPGETIVFEFKEDVDQGHVMVQPMANGLPVPSSKYTLELKDARTLLFSVKEDYIGHLHLALDEGRALDIDVVRPQKIVVVDSNGTELSSVDVPVSIRGVIAMTPDLHRIRLVRSTYLGWLWIGLLEYEFDMESGQLGLCAMHSGRIFNAEYLLLDWIRATDSAAQQTGMQYSPAGLSSDGQRLATYEYEKVRITDMVTLEQQLFSVQSRQGDLGDFPNPQRVFWSQDNNSLYYSANADPDAADNLYCLDLVTGQESMVAVGHYLRSASPHGTHLFTNKWEETSSGFYLLDYSSTGQSVRLSMPGGSVALTKWIDAERALVNKGHLRIHGGADFTESKCYIYHISEDRWEFIAEGYGFDMDTETGRVFLLQNR